jgi:hypothetical protein
MNFDMSYIIGALVCIGCAYVLGKSYNNGKGHLHSACKCIKLGLAIIAFFGAILLGNLAFGNDIGESLLEIFNNLFCSFLGVVFAFIWKNDLFSIKKAKPINEDE